MKLIRKRLLYPASPQGNHIYMFTANSVVRNNGCLVMGAGCAKTVKTTYKGVDILLGNTIDHLGRFGVQFVIWNGHPIGAFQTKIDWKDGSPLDLVKYSVKRLTLIAKKRPNHTFHLPCPAVNHGGRSEEEVLPLLESLPDNVYVYLDK
ncbi:hypothetical protein NVP1121O_168 [Vibrio phage 1.121.O._10N.286.46.C4]|nr:hypothetical protein NVP1121O_168 [Vibrio phage 1.121.O._10N.286.46.C4]